VFLLHCLLADSPPDSPREIAELLRNQHLMADRGREPGLRLLRDGEAITPGEWGAMLLTQCAPIAEALDAAQGGAGHRDALDAAARALRDPAMLPSARVLAAMREWHANRFIDFGLARSIEHRRTLEARPVVEGEAGRLAALARSSIAEQAAIEAADTMPFETYRLRYLAQPLIDGEQFRLPA